MMGVGKKGQDFKKKTGRGMGVSKSQNVKTRMHSKKEEPAGLGTIGKTSRGKRRKPCERNDLTGKREKWFRVRETVFVRELDILHRT